MTQDALMQRMITAGVNILNPQEVFDFYHAQNLIDLNELRTFVDQWIATAIAEKVDQDDLDEMQLAADAVKAQLESQINSVTQLAQSNQLNLTSKADVVDLEQTNAQVELNRLAILTKADIAALAMLAQLVDTKADQAYVNQQIVNLVGSAPEALNTVYELAEAIQDNAGIIDTLNQSVANRVRFDVATQALTEIQKQNARTNIGAEESGTAAMLIAQITAASIGAATAAQGSKADTALQSVDVAPVALSGLFSSLSGQNKIFDVVFGAYALGSNAAVVATDTLGQIIGKLQAQINNPPLPVWVDVKTIGSVNAKIDNAYTKLEVMKKDGMMYVRGVMFITGSNFSGEVFRITNPNYWVTTKRPPAHGDLFDPAYNEVMVGIFRIILQASVSTVVEGYAAVAPSGLTRGFMNYTYYNSVNIKYLRIQPTCIGEALNP